MNILQIAEIIIGSIISLGVLIAGAGYGFGKFFEGRNKQTLEETTLFKTRLDALKQICDDQANQINTLQEDIKSHTKEIGRLQGVNEEKEKKIKELTDILANRDPALTEFIKFSMESTKYFQGVVPEIVNKLDNVLRIVERRNT